MKLKITAIFFQIFVSLKCFAQISDKQYRNIICYLKDGLNKDGLTDKVVARENAEGSKQAYLLKIFFKNIDMDASIRLNHKLAFLYKYRNLNNQHNSKKTIVDSGISFKKNLTKIFVRFFDF
ncbi:MAG: hypothetical protein ACRC0E_02745 [Soonwooa sp.]